MDSLRFALAFVVLLPACSCDGGAVTDDTAPARDAFVQPGDDTGVDPHDAASESDDAPGLDAPGLDAPLSDEDAFSAEDAPGAEDAARAQDAAAPRDAGRFDAGCPRSETTRMAGVCDGRGRAICQMWSDGLAGGRMTTSVCVAGGFCARADTCTASDPDTCTCGAGPRCPDEQVCVFGDGRSPRCECISP